MLRYFWTATQKDGIRDTCTEYNVPSKVSIPEQPVQVSFVLPRILQRM